MKKTIKCELYNSINYEVNDVKERLLYLREQHNYSCATIAELLDIDNGSYNKYEQFSNSSLPKYRGMLKLAKLYNVSIEYILTGENNDSDLLNEKFDTLKSLLSSLDESVSVDFMEHIIEMVKLLK